MIWSFALLGGVVVRVAGQVHELRSTWTPKACKLMTFWALFRCFGPLFCIALGSRQWSCAAK